MPRILFLLLCLCSTLALDAQGPDTTYVLSGVVIDDHDGTPLSFAEIHLPTSPPCLNSQQNLRPKNPPPETAAHNDLHMPEKTEPLQS
jgi:hypothetical protein